VFCKGVGAGAVTYDTVQEKPGASQRPALPALYLDRLATGVLLLSADNLLVALERHEGNTPVSNYPQAPYMSSPNPPPAIQLDSLPRSLVDLLTREIACRQARKQLTKSLDEARRQLQMLKATRSPFFMLQPQDVRRDARTSQAEAEATISQSEKGLARLDQLEPKLKSFVAYRLEIYLRHTSQDYVQALLERRNIEDWQRWFQWFEHYCSVFRGTLALLEATITSLQPKQTLAHHPQCATLLTQAGVGAHQIEVEVAFFNKVADAERRVCGPGAHTLYRQLALDWCSAMKSLSEADGKQGPHMIHQFVSQFTAIYRDISRTLHDECPKPVAAEALETNSFHARHWIMLRDAIQLQMPPGPLDELARETDSFLENGRIAELARFQEELVPTPASRPTTPPIPTSPGVTTNPGLPPPPKPKPVLQLRSRRNVTGAPFGTTPPVVPGAENAP
jgi:hypothetical protein